MGIEINGARFVLYCKSLGVDFAKTAMIGRQGLYLTQRDLARVFESFGYKPSARQIETIFTQSDGFAEPFFKSLGAREVHSFDNSGYEGASHLHDMNSAIPEPLKEQYSVVLDGGSLEHVFNLPVALKNCMEMVRVGGHFLAITPANNFLGHGFYQFSPELFFSVFTRENGFELSQLIALENLPSGKWFSVKSPVEVKGRVTLTNSVPVYLLVIAKRIAHTRIFEKPPQQSDYVSQWDKAEDERASGRSTNGQTPHSNKPAWVAAIDSRVFLPVRRLIRTAFRRPMVFNHRFFTPMDPTTGSQAAEKTLSDGP